MSLRTHDYDMRRRHYQLLLFHLQRLAKGNIRFCNPAYHRLRTGLYRKQRPPVRTVLYYFQKHEEIGRRINKDLHRGVTFIDGVGCYTHNGVKMMFVLAKKRESNTIFRLIKDIDPKAFVSQSAVIDVSLV